MSAYERRDEIRDSRAALIEEYKKARKDWTEMTAQQEARHAAERQLWEIERKRLNADIDRLNTLLCVANDSRWWGWLRDLLPRRAKT